MSRKERKLQIDRLLGQFGLDNKRRQIASTLSGGERRRLEIARCLASKPALILLGRAIYGIDPVTIHSIQDIIADLCDSGISILLTDHRERETLTITHRNYIICAGKVIVSGDARNRAPRPQRDARVLWRPIRRRVDHRGQVGLRLGGGEPQGSAISGRGAFGRIPATNAAAKTARNEAPRRLTFGPARPKPD